MEEEGRENDPIIAGRGESASGPGRKRKARKGARASIQSLCFH